jgi:hypothetical protein
MPYQLLNFTIMKYTSPSSMLLRTLTSLLLLASMACNKKLPVGLPCGCEPEAAVYTKGNSSQKLASCGILNLPIDSTLSPAALVIAYLGQEPVGDYDIPELGSTKTLPFFSSSALQIESVGWHFSVSASINDLKGNVLVQIMDNKWYVNTDNVGKYNYDAKGLEVYDKQGHISLSIDSKPPTTYTTSVNIEGVIPMADNTVALYEIDRFFLPFPYGTPALDSVFEQYYQQWPIQPLFRYTGPNWQHARLSAE